jgi:hypothetical protein
MKRIECDPQVQVPVETCQTPEGLSVRAQEYSLLFRADKSYINLSDKTGYPWAELFVGGSIETINDNDENFAIKQPTWQSNKESTIVRIGMESTAWEQKEMVWICRPDVAEIYYDVEGNGDLTECNYFAGYYAANNNSGFFASGANFKQVFNPEPTREERWTHPVNQLSDIDVTGSAVPGREGWYFTPAPYCFGLSSEPTKRRNHITNSRWLMIGLTAPIEKQNFTGIHYDGREKAFSLRASYEGKQKVEGRFKTPSAVLHFADNPYDGIKENAAISRKLGYLPEPERSHKPENWWSKPIFCGWGAQEEMKNLTGIGGTSDYANQGVYDELLATLKEQEIIPGTIVLDDKWQKEYGTNTADSNKWPDLKKWVKTRHDLGQHVLLWLKAWDPEGLPEELCVRSRNRSNVGVDPSNPDYEEILRRQVQNMLSSDGYDADGFKIDFTARTPSGRSLEHHGPQWGAALLHRLLKTIYDEAKKIKKDSLIVTHTPNPWFMDITDMVRLNDINDTTPVVESMRHRAKIVEAVDPNILIDTDNYPMPSRAEWRRYLKVQSQIGIPALYFATHVGSKLLQPSDYKAIRQSWDNK